MKGMQQIAQEGAIQIFQEYNMGMEAVSYTHLIDRVYSKNFCPFSVACDCKTADPEWKIKKIYLFFYGTCAQDVYKRQRLGQVLEVGSL